MRKAKIDNGVVVNVELVDPESIPEHAKQWPECPESVSKGWTYDGETFAAPDPEPVTQDMIEAEADRRVLEVANDRQQRRLLAEQQVLAAKGALTSAEQERVSEINGVFASIAAIWEAADVLIATDPRPLDFQNDNHWP